MTRATRGEGASGLALALARTFAGVGTATILVSADLRGRTVREQEGLSALLDGTATSMPLIALEENLMWLPEGTSNALPETLFSAPRVERIVRDLRDVAGVVVIDTPAVLEDSETLPLIACSDIVLLTVRPGATRWNPLGSAVSLIQRVAKRPLHICYDRAPAGSSVPAAGRARAGAGGAHAPGHRGTGQLMTRLLVVGLDGGTDSVIGLPDANLPNIAAVRDQGASGTLDLDRPADHGGRLAVDDDRLEPRPARHVRLPYARDRALQPAVGRGPLGVVRGWPRLRHLAALVGCRILGPGGGAGRDPVGADDLSRLGGGRPHGGGLPAARLRPQPHPAAGTG